MNYFRTVAIVTLAVLGLFLSTSALAAPSIRDALPQSAHADWDAARELYDAGDAKSALVHFQKAYELSRNPRVLFNVGVCFKDLTLYAQAIRVWEQELGYSDQLDASDIEQLEFAIAAARRFVSTLELHTDQPGAALSIDGTLIGKTPFLAPLPIDVGRRQLKLSKDGFTSVETTVDVIQGQPLALTLNLTPVLKLGTVSVTVLGAASATLFMDGRELGRTPYRGQVPQGPHTFEARAPGFEPARQTSSVEYAQTLQLTLALAETRNEGKVRIITDHPDALIAIDGQVQGSGGWEGILPAGGHQLQVEKGGYEVFREELSLSRDQVRSVHVQLTRKRSWVWWTVGIVAVVGGSTAAAVLLSRPTDTAPVTGTLDTVSPRF